MSRKIVITELQLNALISEQGFNIHGVYHVSPEAFDVFKTNIHFPYIFFSDKPIAMEGSRYIYKCDLRITKPFVFHSGESWSYPLWLYLTDRQGHLIPEEEFTRDKYDRYLGCPYEFWSIIYYDDLEYETDQIPEIVKQLNLGYDGVVIKDVSEGDLSTNVDDYVVFSPEQVRIVERKPWR